MVCRRCATEYESSLYVCPSCGERTRRDWDGNSEDGWQGTEHTSDMRERKKDPAAIWALVLKLGVPVLLIIVPVALMVCCTFCYGLMCMLAL